MQKLNKHEHDDISPAPSWAYADCDQEETRVLIAAAQAYLDDGAEQLTLFAQPGRQPETDDRD